MGKYNISDEDLSDDSMLYDDEQTQQQQLPEANNRMDEEMFNDRESLGMDNRDEYYGNQNESPMDRHGDLLKDLTDFDSYIKDTVNGWLGRYWDAEKEKWQVNPKMVPIMNEHCAVWCVTFLKTYTRKNNIITNISANEYANIIEDIIEVVWLNIGVRYEDFGIKTTGDILRICTEMQHAAELVLMGAGSGKYNAFLMGTYNQSESSGNRDDRLPRHLRNQKQGLLGKAKNWLWG